jgi:hypothetical protein
MNLDLLPCSPEACRPSTPVTAGPQRHVHTTRPGGLDPDRRRSAGARRTFAAGLRTALLATVVTSCTTADVLAQPSAARLAGTVADTSGGVLPGVLVSVTAADANVLTTVSGAEGEYMFDGLTPGVYAVAFELSGFDRDEQRVQVVAGEEATVDSMLGLAGLQETVTVTAVAVPEPTITIPETRVFPDVSPVEDHASVCGIRKAGPEGPRVATVAAMEEDGPRHVLGDRDLVLIDAGRANGVEPGVNFVVRRRFVVLRNAAAAGAPMTAEHTAALIQVVDATEHSAIARPVYVCNEIAVGDRIEPFEPQPVWTPAAGGRPDFSEPAHVLFADQGRTLAAPAEMLVIDRGARDGVRPGQWVTVFRRSLGRGSVDPVGEALIVAVQADSATIRVENSRDAIEVGDAAALHR